MGLLDEYGVDLADVEAASFDVKDDIYEFEVGDFYIQNGTDNFPDRIWAVIQYLLGEEGKSKTEWFELPDDPSDMTPKERQKMGFLKARLLDLGCTEEQAASPEPEFIVGVTGTLQVFTRNGFQNIKNVQIETDGTNEFRQSAADEEPEAEEEAPEEEAPKPARRPAAKAAAPVAKKVAPAARATAARATKAGVKANPFGK